MLPGWEIWGEGAVISHTYRYGRGVRVGDLVKFKVPISEDDAIKRVAGMPGDYVLVHTPDTGHDEMIQVSFSWKVRRATGTDSIGCQVPQGHCWVLGDNLFASKDSRIYGPLPMALIDGKVIFKTGSAPWQWSRMKKIKNPFEEQQNSSK